jgi:hypothetical protein
MRNEELYKNLVALLKIFKNRPHHLAKYLLDNSALSEDFIKKIKNSDKLKDFDINDIDPDELLPIDFNFEDISKMEKFYNSLIDDLSRFSEKETTKEINKKLDELLKQERYEDAARIRDYMSINNIKRIS